MKGINTIKNFTSKGLMALTVLFLISTAIFAAPVHFSSYSAGQQIFEKDRLQLHHFIFNGSNKKSVLKFAASRTKKSNILAETDLVIARIEPYRPVIEVQSKTAFYNSLYSLPFVYHFTSRGPPSA